MNTQTHRNFQHMDVVEVVSNCGLSTPQNIEFLKVGSIVPFAGSSPSMDLVLHTMNNGSLCACNFRTMVDVVMPHLSLLADERAETILFVGGTLIKNGRKFVPSLQEAYNVCFRSGKKIPVRTWTPALIPFGDVFSRIKTKKIAVYQ